MTQELTNKTMKMIKIWAFAWAAVVVTSCGTLSTLEDRAVQAGETVVNPQEREIHYRRIGNDIHYLHFECAGDFCHDDLRRDPEARSE